VATGGFVIPGRRRLATRPSWPFSINYNSEQARGLIAWFPLCAGVPFGADLMRGDVLAVQGGPTPIGTAGLGACFNGDGVNKELGGQVEAFNINLTEMTVIARFIARSTGGSGFGRIVNQSDHAVFGMNISNATTLGWDIVGSSQVTGTFALNNETHAAGVYKSGSRHELWVNGAKSSGSAGSGGLGSIGDIYIAGRQLDGGRCFDGPLTDVRIYNYALSDALIREITVSDRRWDLYAKPTNRTTFLLALPTRYVIARS
jgi:hypothetical protein